MLKKLVAAAPLAALRPTAALAGHQPIDVFAEARGLAQTTNGVTVSAVGDIRFRSGAIVGTPIASGVGAGAAWEPQADGAGRHRGVGDDAHRRGRRQWPG